MLAEDLRAALEKHFREASELIKEVGRGEKHGVWEDQHVVALLQGFQRWYDEPSGGASQESKDFEERKDMVFSLSDDGVSHFTHGEKEQIVHDLGLLDQESRGELMDMLAEVEALRAQQEQLDVAREVAEDAVHAPPDESLQTILNELAEKEAEVQRLATSVQEAVEGAGLGDTLLQQQQGQRRAMEVLVNAPGQVDATFGPGAAAAQGAPLPPSPARRRVPRVPHLRPRAPAPGDRGRGAVVQAVTGWAGADHSPLASSGLVRPGMVLTEVNGVGTVWLKHSAVLTLLADTDAEPRRILRFRSPERHAYLRRCVPPDARAAPTRAAILAPASHAPASRAGGPPRQSVAGRGPAGG